MAKRDKWPQLLEDFGTVPEIKELLRKYRAGHEDDLPLTGKKEDVIEAVVKGVKNKWIPFDAVVDVIREGEENGGQHIYYYQPRTDRVKRRCEKPDVISVDLFGEDAGDLFPRFDLVPNEYQWSDWRARKVTQGRFTWTAKIYGQRQVLKWVRDLPKGEGVIHKVYNVEEERIVCVVRWNPPDLLEVRIQGADSRKQTDERLRIVWKMLAPAIREDDFVPWSLKGASRRIVAERKDHAELYRINTGAIIDDTGATIRIEPSTEDENIGETAERDQTIDLFMENDETTTGAIAVHWHPDDTKTILKSELRTVLGSYAANDVSIQATSSISSWAVDYVTNQLRQFSRE